MTMDAIYSERAVRRLVELLDDKVKEHLEEVIEAYQQLEMYEDAAKLLEEYGNDDRAAQLYETAIAHYEENNLFFKAALVAERIDQTERAIENYIKADEPERAAALQTSEETSDEIEESADISEVVTDTIPYDPHTGIKNDLDSLAFALDIAGYPDISLSLYKLTGNKKRASNIIIKMIIDQHL